MEEILIFGHKNPDTDSICSSIALGKLLKKLGKNVKVVRLGNLNKETKYALNYLKIQEPEFIEKVDDNQKVILVDHNEAAQSVNNRENAEIIGVVDHHRIADISTTKPLYYLAKPYGCTATILFELFKQENVEIDKETAILLLSAITSDTLLLKSPTCTKKDVETFNELEKIAKINAKEYGLNMLKAGTDISDLSAKEIINLDSKEFNEKGKKFEIDQVNTADINDVFSRKNEINAEIEKEIANKNLDLFMFVITDIINTNSKVIVLGKEKGLIEKAFNKKLDNENSMMLEGVVSRKKQIVPPILSNL